MSNQVNAQGNTDTVPTSTSWDIRDHLKSDEACLMYLEACFAGAPNDAAFLAKALSDVVQARANFHTSCKEKEGQLVKTLQTLVTENPYAYVVVPQYNGGEDVLCRVVSAKLDQETGDIVLETAYDQD